MEVRDRFKGLDLVNRVPEKLRTEVCNIVQEAVNKTIPKKKQCKKTKSLSEEASHIAEDRKRSEKQRRKGKVHPTKHEIPETSGERKESLLK